MMSDDVLNAVDEFTTLEVPLDEIIAMANEICYRHSRNLCQPGFQYENLFLKQCQQFIQLATERRSLLEKLDFELNKDLDKKAEFYSKVEPFVTQLAKDLVNELAQLGLCYLEREAGDQFKIEALVDELNSACSQLQDLFYEYKSRLVESIPEKSKYLNSSEMVCSESPTKIELHAYHVKPPASSKLSRRLLIDSAGGESFCMPPSKQSVEAKLEPSQTRFTDPPNVDTEVEKFIKLKTPLKQIISLADSYCKMLLHKEDPCEPDFMFEDYFLKVCASCREFSIDRISKLPIIIDSFVENSDRLDFCRKLEAFMQQFSCILVQALKRLGKCYIERGVDSENINNELKSVTEHTSKLRKTLQDQMKTQPKVNKKSNNLVAQPSVRMETRQEQSETSLTQNVDKVQTHQQKLNLFSNALDNAQKLLKLAQPVKVDTRQEQTQKETELKTHQQKPICKADTKPPPTRSTYPPNVDTEVENFTKLKTPLSQSILLANCYCKILTNLEDPCKADYMYEDYFLEMCQSCREFCIDRISKLPTIISRFQEESDRRDFCQNLVNFIMLFTCQLVQALKRLGKCYIERGLDRNEINCQLDSVTTHTSKLRKCFLAQRKALVKEPIKMSSSPHKKQVVVRIPVISKIDGSEACKQKVDKSPQLNCIYYNSNSPPKHADEAQLEPPKVGFTPTSKVDVEVENFIQLMNFLKPMITLADNFCSMHTNRDNPCKSDFMYTEFFLPHCQITREFFTEQFTRLSLVISSFAEDSDRLHFCQRLQSFLSQFLTTLLTSLKKLANCYIMRDVGGDQVVWELKSVQDEATKLRSTLTNQVMAIKRSGIDANGSFGGDDRKLSNISTNSNRVSTCTDHITMTKQLQLLLEKMQKLETRFENLERNRF